MSMTRFFCQVKSTKGIIVHHEIFRNYPDTTYLVKLRKLNRPIIYFKDIYLDRTIGIAVLDRHGRHQKICLVIVHPEFKQHGLGTQIIKFIQGMFTDDFNDLDVLYTVCPHQFNTDNYQKLLIKNGFQPVTIKSNGDIIYSYAKPV